MYSKSSLEMLDAVARLGSFTAAAELLHKVPSAISYGVRQVEQELDVVLFRRLPRKVELTPAGELFIAQARLLLRQMEEINAQTRRAAHGWQSTLKLTLDNVVKLDKLKSLETDSQRLHSNLAVVHTDDQETSQMSISTRPYLVPRSLRQQELPR